jgi:hypothetical protein
MPFLYEAIPHTDYEGSAQNVKVEMELDEGTSLDLSVGVPPPAVPTSTPSLGPARQRQKKSYISSGFVELSKLAVIMQRVLTAL